MFDIDYILGKRTMKQKPLISNMNFPSFFSEQKNIKKSIYTTQKSFLKNTPGGQSKRFFDTDKDKVINGLDCFPYNTKRHSLYPMTDFEQELYLDNAYKFFTKPNEINDYLGMRHNLPTSKGGGASDEDTAKEAVLELGEVDEQGICKGNCKKISEKIANKIKGSKLIISNPKNSFSSGGHMALQLNNGNIIDTQLWQHNEGKPTDLKSRKVMFTQEEYSKYYDVENGGGSKIFPKKIDKLSDLKPLVKKLKGKTKLETIKKTVSFVEKSLPKYKFSYYPKPVPEAYNSKTADCTEVAKMTYYLLKQNKVPSRISHGIVAYSDNDFQKHDYAEVKLGKRWIPVDNGTWPYRERYGGGVW